MNRPRKDNRGIETRFGGFDDDGEMLPGDHPSFYLHTKVGMYELVRITGALDDSIRPIDEMAEIDALIRAGNPPSK